MVILTKNIRFTLILLIPIFNAYTAFSQIINEEFNDKQGCNTSFVRLGCTQFYYTQFSKIELISIHPKCDSGFNYITKEYDTICNTETIIIDSSKLDFTRVNERRVIADSLEIRNILKILYKNQQTEHEEYFCGYQPRNGILFYDVNDQLVGYLEICFQCHVFRIFGKAPEMVNYCNNMISNLQNLFSSNGIK